MVGCFRPFGAWSFCGRYPGLAPRAHGLRPFGSIKPEPRMQARNHGASDAVIGAGLLIVLRDALTSQMVDSPWRRERAWFSCHLSAALDCIRNAVFRHGGPACSIGTCDRRVARLRTHQASSTRPARPHQPDVLCLGVPDRGNRRIHNCGWHSNASECKSPDHCGIACLRTFSFPLL